MKGMYFNLISIIIPTWNEEKKIEPLLNQIESLSGEKEILIVDGGSKDRTVKLVEQRAKVLQSELGRAKQMNKGAQEAKGEIFWFVHADAKISLDSLKEIEKASQKGALAGYFRMYFHDDKRLFFRWLSWSSNLRARWFHLIFGDQGLFIHKQLFRELGGFKEIELMEDWDISRRLLRVSKAVQINCLIGTSARRFHPSPMKTLWRMHQVKWRYLRGVPPKKLKEFYDDK